MREKVSQLAGLRDVTTDLYIKNPQMSLDIDRETAAIYGISIDQIRNELFDCYGNRQIGTIYTASADYQIIEECLKDFQSDPNGLSKIFVKTNVVGTPAGTIGGVATGGAIGGGVTGNGVPSGMSIPMSAVAKLTPTVGPLQVNHQGQQPAVTISFNLAPGFSLGQAVDAIKQIERQLNMPPTIGSGFQGSAQGLQGSLKG